MANSWLRQFAVITPTSVHGYELKSAGRWPWSVVPPASDIQPATSVTRNELVSEGVALCEAGGRRRLEQVTITRHHTHSAL